MSDEEPTAEAEESAERTVPVSQVQKERKERQAAQKELAELRAWKQEQEEAGKSEVERLTKRTTELQQALEDRDRQAARETKRNLLKDAAASAHFHDPAAAAQLIDSEVFNGIDSEAAARAAVKALAKDKSYLVKPAEPAPQGAQKILANGEVIDSSKTDGAAGADPELAKGQAILAALTGGR